MKKIISSKEIMKKKFFKIKEEIFEIYPNQLSDPHYIFEFSDWIDVAAYNKDMQLLTIKNYRHARRDYFREIPAGTIEKGETPLDCAKRELLEETGYQAKKWTSLPIRFPNPTINTNKVFPFIALECDFIGETKKDPNEDIQDIRFMDPTEVLRLINTGEIVNPLQITTILTSMLKLGLISN